MRVKFTAITKNNAMPTGIRLKIEGTASVPNGTSKAQVIKSLQEYAAEEFTKGDLVFVPSAIKVTLG